jgi:ubiquinone/menaquinone biosynthesis C-methylase UbiE
MPHEIFDALPGEYDRWYDDHLTTYLQELKIVGNIPGVKGSDLEVGVGTGRFAAPLGIRLGLDPSLPMLRMARERGVQAVRGMAEAMPFRDACLQSVLVMTSLCYFDDPRQAFREIHRVLLPGGRVVIGFLGKGGETAEQYRKTREKGTFLSHATFYTPDEVRRMVGEAGFSVEEMDTRGRASMKGFHVMTATRPG